MCISASDLTRENIQDVDGQYTEVKIQIYVIHGTLSTSTFTFRALFSEKNYPYVPPIVFLDSVVNPHY